MAFNNNVTIGETIPGRRIIFAKTVGKANPMDLATFENFVLEEVADWKDSGWAYVTDVSRMAPTFTLESNAMLELTRDMVAAGCKALVFVEGKSSMIRIQAHDHVVRSGTGVKEGHFKTLEEALDWLDKELGI